MKDQGFVTHERRNRRIAHELIGLYLVACQLTGMFAISTFLIVFDPGHLIIADPIGYVVRYGLPVLALSGLFFWFHYTRHARAVKRKLKIREVDGYSEPRFARIAETQCIAQGVKLPRLGVWEAPERNALTVGQGPRRGLIAVTRGLLDGLDDDELAAVLAHEAAHIRHGDTMLLAVNHALHRTAISMSIENPFRFDHWAVLIIIMMFPLLLPVFVAGHLATWVATRLSWFARGRVALRRDYLADAAAVRMTHDPAALVSAMRKVSGRSRFPGLARVAGVCFDDLPVEAGGVPNAGTSERIAAVERLSGDLLTMPRTRRDTRGRKFGVVRPTAPAPALPAEMWLRYGEDGRPLARPPKNSDLPLLTWLLTDPAKIGDWLDATYAWWEWRPSDKRIGTLKPEMVIPVLACVTFLGVFHWPADNSLRTFAAQASPMRLVEYGQKFGLNGSQATFCSGPSYPDGKCPQDR